MVNFLKKIPAGTFLVPLLLSALLYTLWPNLFRIGGVTEALLGGTSTNFIIGMLTFCSGLMIDFSEIGALFKRHGILVLVKIAISFAVSLLYMNIFGQEGIFGISALAFTVGMFSMNPAVYIALVSEYGKKQDQAAFALTALFSIPVFPMLTYAVAGSGEVDWMPIVSTFIPLIIGIVLGNLDKDFNSIFGTGVTVLTPILGWNLGQSMNLVEALQSGLPGIILCLFFYLLMSPLFIVDYKVLKNDGIVGLSMTTAAGSSTAFPAVIAASSSVLMTYVPSAVAQLLTLAIITIVLTPIITRYHYSRVYPNH
ncbi:2-keto-3-deoxygluconate permease [Fundicoccus culcitae]|uniref:2-keto-3-deoxygluconate permease n=1 Tax=Fundicoccus culcitae TaxID=2969821 RepID=A0ABY5P638_9LACT|nr:2-keto-3-deoxygluconate permease [Fundicoccus culcitae]UUX33950.1 2-keto-3-deoxygluconate permease [Fundicoccus culcitae]